MDAKQNLETNAGKERQPILLASGSQPSKGHALTLWTLHDCNFATVMN